MLLKAARFLQSDPAPRLPRRSGANGREVRPAFETRSRPTLTRSYPRRFTFYVARPMRSIQRSCRAVLSRRSLDGDGSLGEGGSVFGNPLNNSPVRRSFSGGGTSQLLNFSTSLRVPFCLGSG